MLAGARPGEEGRVEEFCTTLLWAPVTEAVTREAAGLYRTYHASHGGIDDVDFLIAATVLALEAALLTTNVRHFPMFERLEPAYR